MVTTTPRKVCVVGSGMTYLSGISYYTYFLVENLSADHNVSAILMRNLVPRRLYPGSDRIGESITGFSTADIVPTFNGIDWTTVPSVFRALGFLAQQDPDVIVLQWWSASSLPGYHSIAAWARHRKIPVIVELHEGLHQAEADIAVLGSLALKGFRALLARANAYVVHSLYDEDRFVNDFGLLRSKIAVIPSGPFTTSPAKDRRRAPIDIDDFSGTTILFFGTIRPYKGLEDLVAAFDLLERNEGQQWRLLIVGEPWEDWTKPFEAIEASPHRNEIITVLRYVTDDEAEAYFDQADIVALPYLRSSVSGPLQLTMHRGLPVVVTDVGGLTSAVKDYKGAVLTPVSNPAALANGIATAKSLVGTKHEDPHSWTVAAHAYGALFEKVLNEQTPREAIPPSSA